MRKYTENGIVNVLVSIASKQKILINYCIKDNVVLLQDEKIKELLREHGMKNCQVVTDEEECIWNTIDMRVLLTVQGVENNIKNSYSQYSNDECNKQLKIDNNIMLCALLKQQEKLCELLEQTRQMEQKSEQPNQRIAVCTWDKSERF